MVRKQDENMEKENTILDAAQKRFAHYGLSKTTMIEIATDIGMSKASLYYYFPDKEAIFKAVILREQNEFMAQMQKMLIKPKTASQYLMEYTKKRHTYFKEFLNIAKLRSDSMNQVKPIFHELFSDLQANEISLLKTIIKQGVDDQEFKKIDIAYHAELFSTLMAGLRSVTLKYKAIELLDASDYDTLEKHLHSLANIFIHGITK
jgi:TetR/AcrR family transcriptional regulator